VFDTFPWKEESSKLFINLLDLHAKSTSEFIETNFPPRFRLNKIDHFKLIGDEACRHILTK
jgi:hypothetical protein